MKNILRHFVKNIIKRTFLFNIIESFQIRKAFKTWTDHDQEMLDFYSQFIAPFDLCFDVGANIGNRLKIFLQLQANVVAIEPQEECVRILEIVYGKNKKFTMIQKALGEFEGVAELMECNINTISSMSQEWIESVRRSGRFSRFVWDKKQVVPLTTLDKLIEEYGIPSFIKIDVEGFEEQVIKGLTQPVKALSLEFTPEFLESTFECISYLQHLGEIQLNFSLGETMKLGLKKWVDSHEMIKILSGFRKNNKLFGDVYIQFKAYNIIQC